MAIENENTEDIIQDTGENLPAKREERDIPPIDVELRIDDSDKPKITGYATKYGNFYDLGWFMERIKKGAFDEALKISDVRCLKNHDPNLILGRTANKTLRLESNSVGLKFDNDIPDTTTGKDTREEIRRGDISGCSFSFTVAEDDWKYFEDDRPSERTIVKIAQLFDVGPVVYPANPKTTVSARDYSVAKRSLDKFKEDNPEAAENTEATEHQIHRTPNTEGESQDTDPEVKEETEESEKLKRKRRLETQRGYQEAGCILKRVTDQINEINKD